MSIRVDAILDRFVQGTPGLKEISERYRIKESFRVVFGTPDGHAVLRYILRNSCTLRSTYGRGVDRDLMMIREGERRLALSILRMVCRNDDELINELEETSYAS